MSTNSRPPRRDNDERSFLGRWARRKAQASRPDPAEATPAALTGAIQGDANADPEAADTADTTAPAADPQPAATESDPQPANPESPPVPALESLGEDSDYARFMAPDVGPELRRLALRKMFKAPVFNVRDGLDDYDEDFTTFSSLGKTLTADMKYQQERLRLAASEAEAKELPDPPQPTVAATAAQPGDESPADEPVHDDNDSDAADTRLATAKPPLTGSALPADNPVVGTTSRGPAQQLPRRPDEAPPPIMAGDRRPSLTPPPDPDTFRKS